MNQEYRDMVDLIDYYYDIVISSEIDQLQEIIEADL